MCDDGARAACLDFAGPEPLPDHLKKLLNPPVKMDDGDDEYWIVEAFAARANNVQSYPYGEVFRPADEVFSDASLRSYANKPFRILHPQQTGEREPLVTAEMVDRTPTAGAVIEAIKLEEHDLVKVRIAVWSERSMREFREGRMVELSAGYHRDLVAEPGVAPDGTPYTHVMRNIRVNHLAQVKAARAGRLARAALDSRGDVMLYLIRQIAGRHAVCDAIDRPLGSYPSREEALKRAAACVRSAAVDAFIVEEDGAFKVLSGDEGYKEMGSFSTREEAESEVEKLHAAGEGGPGGAEAMAAYRKWAESMRSGGDMSGAEYEEIDGVRVHKDDVDMARKKMKGADTDSGEVARLRTQVTDAREQVSALKAERDAARAELRVLHDAEAERELKTLRSEAGVLLGAGVSLDGMAETEIQRRVIGSVKAYQGLDLSAYDATGIRALYDGARKILSEGRGEAADSLNGAPGGAPDPAGGQGTDSEGSSQAARRLAARKKWLKRQQRAEA